jgi:tetratricopeptide (TPR) repeat protein
MRHMDGLRRAGRAVGAGVVCAALAAGASAQAALDAPASPEGPGAELPGAMGNPVAEAMQRIDAALMAGDLDTARAELDALEQNTQAMQLIPAASAIVSVKRGEIAASAEGYDAARPLYVQAVAQAKAALGPRQGVLTTYLLSLADLDRAFAREQHAVAPLEEAVSVERYQVPWNVPRLVSLEVRLAETLELAGEPRRAERVYRDAMERLARSPGQAPAWLWSSAQSAYGRLLLRQQRVEEATELFAAPIRAWTTLGDPAKPAVAAAELDLGTLLAYVGRDDEAAAQLASARGRLGSAPGEWRSTSLVHDLKAARLLRMLGRFDDALTLIAHTRTAFTALSPDEAAQAGMSGAVLDADRAATLIAAGRYDQAADVLRSLYGQVPDDNFALELFVANARAGRLDAARAALQRHRDQRLVPVGADIAGPIIDALLDDTPLSQVQQHGSQWAPGRRLGYLSSAFYYLGQSAMAEGDPAEARRLWTLADRTARWTNPAWEMAGHELGRAAQ